MPSLSSIPLVTVSIVSHGQWALAAPLLQALHKHCAEWIDRVVLTLNLPERLPHDLPFAELLTVVRNPQPLGFGANHNRAFLHCTSEWFLVLNPDIRLDMDVVGSLLGAAQETAGLLAPRIQEPGRSVPEPYRRLPTPTELWQRRQAGHVAPPSPEWVAGMFMLVRARAWQDVNGFDERFFMYCEDADFCVRLQSAGWRLQIEENVHVVHAAQRASQRSLQHLYWHVGSLLKFWSTPTLRQYLRTIRMHRQS
jgi:GT2 family glycosyltransferase